MSDPSILSDLTTDEKKRVLALDYVMCNLSEQYTLAEEITPAAAAFLEFINTGKYEMEEAEVKKFNVVPKEEDE